MGPAEPTSDFGVDLPQLLTDLQGLVDAGLLVEVRSPGEPSRYALSEFSRYALSESEEGLTSRAQAEPSRHEFPLEGRA